MKFIADILKASLRYFFILSYFLFITGIIIYPSALAQDQSTDGDLNVISGWLQYSDVANSFYHNLVSQATDYLDARAVTVNRISTKDQFKIRQEKVSKILSEIVGPFPDKTPLNVRITNTVKKKTFHIENIVFESQPGFFVTSSLFIPKGIKGKAPAIIYCSGHSNDGYRNPVYQHVILNLVNKGFVVFAFDPVGQGERLEYLDPQTGKSSVGGPTSEHSWPGAQAFIAGNSEARYMIFDGIRAVDYLLTRKEVDPFRIGITGRSGGGTQSAYIAAFDDRIYAAAPECFITSFKRLLQSIGPQDAEQNFFHEIAEGIDHADLLEVRAPKPALMITTTNDFFSIQGARETAAEVSSVYKLLGVENNFAMVEDVAEHASTKKNREAMYTFFQKNLNNPGDPSDVAVGLLSPEELKVTETGQVSTSFHGETIFSLNRKFSEELTRQLDQDRKDLPRHLAAVKKSVTALSGISQPDNYPNPVFTGKILRKDYIIEKYFFENENGYPVPYLMFTPEHPNGKGLMYLNSAGKYADANIGDIIEWFVHNNITVLAADLPGTGELRFGNLSGDSEFKDSAGNNVSYNLWFASILTGRSITGMQAEDILLLAGIFKKMDGISEIFAYSDHEISSALLQAAVLEPAISRVALESPLISYASVVMNRYYDPALIPEAVAGMLASYDLPDMEACLAPRKLLLINISDQSGIPALHDSIMNELSVVYSAFSESGHKENLIIENSNSQDELKQILSRWLK